VAGEPVALCGRGHRGDGDERDDPNSDVTAHGSSLELNSRPSLQATTAQAAARHASGYAAVNEKLG